MREDVTVVRFSDGEVIEVWYELRYGKNGERTTIRCERTIQEAA